MNERGPGAVVAVRAPQRRTRTRLRGLAGAFRTIQVVLLVLLLFWSSSAAAQEDGIWGRPVERGGFHVQVVFGIGGGPDTFGLFHSMEVGGTTHGHTIALLHTFIQNKGFFGGNYGGPDLIGGWMLQYKHALWAPDVVGKVALGLGGTHDQSQGIKAHPGLGVSYGVDLHYPVWSGGGPTLTLAGMNVFARRAHHFGAGLGLGMTKF